MLVLHPPQRFHHPPLDDDVEGARRLVGDDQLGPHADGDGDAHALLHAAAQLVGKQVGDLRLEIDGLQQLGQPLVPPALAHSARRAPASRRSSAVRMRTTGLSEFIAPCVTSAMCASRTLPHLLFAQAEQVDPVEEDARRRRSRRAV